MEKRYQVFISSTYTDLIEERQAVLRALMQMKCMPAGMEFFPAQDTGQIEFIKKVIADCDYYILIMGGRYGSLSPEGISYTEAEFDYALSIGLKPLVFLHGNPDSIPRGKTDKNDELASKLEAFRAKVSVGRLVKAWNSADQLQSAVIVSLVETITQYPAVGWVRANSLPSTTVLTQVSELAAQNEELRAKVQQLYRTEPTLSNLAPLEERVRINMSVEISRGILSEYALETSWSEIFGAVAPYLLETPADESVKNRLSEHLATKLGRGYRSTQIAEHDFQTVKIQFMALGLVEIKHLQSTAGTMVLYWFITAKGRETMFEVRAVRA